MYSGLSRKENGDKVVKILEYTVKKKLRCFDFLLKIDVQEGVPDKKM